MDIKVAETAGFCFGVDNAVKTVYSLLAENKKVATLGPIIHNETVVDDMKKKGVIIIDNVSDCLDDYNLVIRSHGVPKKIYDEIDSKKIQYTDCTCPFVTKIHKIVKEEHKTAQILIAGDVNHAEVIGINGFCDNKAIVFDDFENLDKKLKLPENADKPMVLVAQTTYNIKKWKKGVSNLKKVCTNLKIYDTICSATTKRQNEAVQLSNNVDVMIVIGGKNSSNTKKLKEICEENCKTIFIENTIQLNDEILDGSLKFGITAGASTPKAIIKEVLNHMSENVNNIETDEEDFCFATALEESLNPVHRNQKVTGVVISISANEIQVDIGRKHTGLVHISEMTNDSTAKMEDLVKKGDELDFLVLKVNDQEGTAMLSKKRLDSANGFNLLVTAFEEGTILEGKITDVLKGGVLALAGATKVFIPAPHVSLNRGQELEPLKNTTVQFKIIDVDKIKKRAVASVKAILAEQQKVVADKFWETLEVGQKFNGVVKSITAYGAFIDLGGVDGMVHISELSWQKVKHPSDVISVGETVEVYIKDLDTEKRKISLGHKKASENPWVVIADKYSVGDEVTAKIVSMTTFGAFAQIIPGVDGLIHISQIANKKIDKVSDVLSVGEEVKARLIELNVDEKRVSLSIRALLEEEEQKREKEIVEEYNDTDKSAE